MEFEEFSVRGAGPGITVTIGEQFTAADAAGEPVTTGEARGRSRVADIAVTRPHPDRSARRSRPRA
ncbi:hypothetical protein ACQP1P_02265 [Dactylosporangium sp. CA-052675]|uniref:hypothetical protein n=1 Tax=Dactylosporangium sp. CA-052675 TaxID=3239927 RepID=UPI003D8E01B7